MKNKLKILGLLTLLPFFAIGQLTINGATLVVESGAKLVVEGDITNTSGTITNDGEIEVKGDFVNNGTLDSDAATSDIVFSGTTAQSFDADGASVRKVTITNTDADVSLLSTGLTITNDLIFGDGSKNLDVSDQILTLGSSAMVTIGTGAGHVKATSTGRLEKVYGSLGNFVFPVGDGTNYTPLAADVTAGTIGTAKLGVNLQNAVHPNLPADVDNDNRNATEYLTRYWDIEETGMGGSFSADVSGTYNDGDDKVLGAGTESLIVGAVYDGVNWNYEDGTNTGSDVVTGKISGSSTFTGSNTFGSGMFSIFLSGAYNQGTGLMSTNLNGGASGILATNALSSPYGTGESVNASFFGTHTDIVDWIRLDVRSSADNTIILSSRSAFLKSDGSIVDIDGTATDIVNIFKNAPENAYISIIHRNHLGIMFNSLSNLLDGTTDIDFTDPVVNTFGTNAQQLNAATNKNLMWAGNADSNGEVRYSGGDIVSVQNKVIANPANPLGLLSIAWTNIYADEDLDMNGEVRYSGGDIVIIQNIVIANPLNPLGLLSIALAEQLPTP